MLRKAAQIDGPVCTKTREVVNGLEGTPESLELGSPGGTGGE